MKKLWFGASAVANLAMVALACIGNQSALTWIIFVLGIVAFMSTTMLLVSTQDA